MNDITELAKFITHLHEKYRDLDDGEIATYIKVGAYKASGSGLFSKHTLRPQHNSIVVLHHLIRPRPTFTRQVYGFNSRWGRLSVPTECSTGFALAHYG